MTLNATNKIDTNKYELEITVGAEAFEAAVAKAYRKNVGKMNVAGFRPGKAPRSVIEKRYGKEVFYEDAVNSLYPQAYEEALTESKLEPVDRAEIEVVSVSEEGFTFKAKVTVKPEVTVSDYKGIKAVKTVKTVTEQDINAEIDKLRERNGRIINVEDRAAQNGDSTVIDFEGFVDGVAFEGGKGEKYPLTLGSNQFIPGFEEQIAGHEIGEEFDVNVEFPEEYQASELAGKPAVFKVKLHEIKGRELPEVNDEFVKDVSEFDTLEAFKADLTAKLQEKFDKAATDDVENQLISAVIEKMEAEIPDCMFEHAIDDMVHDFEHRLQSQGLNLETYLQYTGMEMESFRKTFREQAERQTKIRLALEKVVDLEQISVSEQELEDEYKKVAEGYNIEVEKVKTFIPVDNFSKDIAVNKAIDLIRDSAQITETEHDDKKPVAKKTTTKKSTKAVKTENSEDETVDKPAVTRKKAAKKADSEVSE